MQQVRYKAALGFNSSFWGKDMPAMGTECQFPVLCDKVVRNWIRAEVDMVRADGQLTLGVLLAIISRWFTVGRCIQTGNLVVQVMRVKLDLFSQWKKKTKAEWSAYSKTFCNLALTHPEHVMDTEHIPIERLRDKFLHGIRFQGTPAFTLWLTYSHVWTKQLLTRPEVEDSFKKCAQHGDPTVWCFCRTAMYKLDTCLLAQLVALEACGWVQATLHKT